MQPLILGPLCLLLVVVFSQRVQVYLRRREYKERYGCLAPPELPQLEQVIGISKTLENYRAFRQGCLLSLLGRRFRALGSTFYARLAGNSMIFTLEPENAKAVLATQLEDFDVGWHRRRATSPTMGNFALTSDGAEWHHYRAMLRPAFARRQISDYMTFERDIKVLISRIPRDGSTINMAPHFYKLALSLGTKLLFDESMDSLNPGFSKDFERYLHAFQYVNRGIEIRVRMGILLPLMPRDLEYEKSNEILHRSADAFVQKALDYRRTWETGQLDDKAESNERYVFLRELAKDNEDPVRLRDHLLGMLLAGSETTASLLTSCLSILSNNRVWWGKLRLEVLDVQDLELNYERVKTFTNLNYFINEVLRLYPVIPMWNRLANKDTTIPLGGGPDGDSKIFVPKGSFVAFNTYHMHRRKDLFGPDAEEFRPQRWSELRSQGNWAYLPFSGGPRICIGQQYALMEVSYTLIGLLREFRDIQCRDSEPWLEKIGVSYTNGNGAKVAFVPA